MDLPGGSVGDAIKKARLEKKLTQEKLAELIGITPMHLKQLESGRRNPSIEVLYKLVFTLGLSLDSLFTSSGDSDELQSIKYKISLCLDRCSVHELNVAYATLEALLNKPDD